jgi:hypothetical protein
VLDAFAEVFALADAEELAAALA